jgi:putative transposase
MKDSEPKPDQQSPLKRRTCQRYNLAGHAHSLTFTCFHRQPILEKDRCRAGLIDALVRARQKHNFDLWAYCLMPQHAHILLWPTHGPYDISDILSSVKQSVAKRALLFVQREAPGFLKRMEDCQPSGRTCHRFWQRGGGYDRNLYEPGVIYRQIDYIHANPVRRGLCARPEDWLWSSAADYAAIRKGPAPLQLDSLPPIGEFA